MYNTRDGNAYGGDRREYNDANRNRGYGESGGSRNDYPSTEYPSRGREEPAGFGGGASERYSGGAAYQGGASSSLKRVGGYPERAGESSGGAGLLSGSGSAAKRVRDYGPTGSGGLLESRGGYGGSNSMLSIHEEERLRQLAELEALKREHDLTILRRTLDLDRREVQAALRSRDDPRAMQYPRDRRLDYERRGVHDRDTRRDRIRRSRDRGVGGPPPPRRDRPPPRARSPVRNRLGPQIRSRSRDRSRASDRAKVEAPAPALSPKPAVPSFACEVCDVKFESEEDKKGHDEKDEKHLKIMDQFNDFSQKSGKPIEILVESFLKARREGKNKAAAENDNTKEGSAVEEEEEPDKYPGYFFTGERWRVRVFNPDLTLGSDFVIPVTGYNCAVCDKFFNDEDEAKGNHCRTRSHWDNMRTWLKSNGHKYEPMHYEKFLEEEIELKKRADAEKELEAETADGPEAAPEDGLETEDNGGRSHEERLADIDRVGEDDEEYEEVHDNQFDSQDNVQNDTQSAVDHHDLNDAVDLEYDYEENLDDAGSNHGGINSDQREEDRDRRNWNENNKRKSPNRSTPADHELMSMFDAVDNILQSSHEDDEELDEIPVSVVEDPYAEVEPDNAHNEDEEDNPNNLDNVQENFIDAPLKDLEIPTGDSGLVVSPPPSKQTATRGRVRGGGRGGAKRT